ncbi:hypothetical protein PIB30_080536 [Stylosanthes scabra]|uniref:Uncharacterized protein n=1 Tax=Stylosanthes scabra TaxID=79078 RepID=A0ABU6RRA6_9FABA|nr:hypothetical protein [Stylosanthes scabra]
MSNTPPNKTHDGLDEQSLSLSLNFTNSDAESGFVNISATCSKGYRRDAQWRDCHRRQSEESDTAVEARKGGFVSTGPQ